MSSSVFSLSWRVLKRRAFSRVRLTCSSSFSSPFASGSWPCNELKTDNSLTSQGLEKQRASYMQKLEHLLVPYVKYRLSKIRVDAGEHLLGKWSVVEDKTTGAYVFARTREPPFLAMGWNMGAKSNDELPQWVWDQMQQKRALLLTNDVDTIQHFLNSNWADVYAKYLSTKYRKAITAPMDKILWA
mmetsp:Transcript_40265/g.93281  ORF Transcript_40265/g.93281 Transcript_40265/m.93281 type:complete len:186 (+) Transcript_40265:638-1195(+)